MPATRITAVTIAPSPQAIAMHLTEPRQVTATLDDGTTVALFDYYSDELTFTEADLLGRTLDEAHALHHQRDLDWLRS
jgi:hypothetical protein